MYMIKITKKQYKTERYIDKKTYVIFDFRAHSQKMRHFA